jgi:UDP-N-acetylglucosamine diphosphorylase/glucosamine-1-phosphate N-acetyltransferase
MKLVLFDLPTPSRVHFHPLALSRPIWELRCGLGTLADKVVAAFGSAPAGCFVPPYMAASYRTKTAWKVNDPTVLAGDDPYGQNGLLLVNGRVKAASLCSTGILPVSSMGVPPMSAVSSVSSLAEEQQQRQQQRHGQDARDTHGQDAHATSEVYVGDDGEVLYARITAADLTRAPRGDINALLTWARQSLPAAARPETWNYIWELVQANGKCIAGDFAAQGRSGIEGTVEEPSALRGSRKDVFIAPGALVHPMVVIDAANGPVVIDEGAEIQPFTRIEGPCYIGKKTILLGAKCREGNTIGPMCRVGGEVEESIIQGYSNKYHDGFLGHAYVGEWVNLGALTTNSDLKSDYSNVTVVMDGRTSIDTGSTKVGAMIGDHARTSIGTLFNTGAYVGAMSLIVATGRPLPKFIPSFAWFLDGAPAEGSYKDRLLGAAKIAMTRRKCVWTPDEQAMWEAIFDLTALEREEAIKRGLRK